MSEEKSPFFEPIFNRSVKFRARDQRLSSDGGVLLLREADERLGLVETIASRLYDTRRQDLIRYHSDELLRERIFSLALGYSVEDEEEDVLDSNSQDVFFFVIPVSHRVLARPIHRSGEKRVEKNRFGCFVTCV